MHGRGPGAELRASPLASFTTPGPFWCQAACLGGPHYARSIKSFRAGIFHEVYSWGETNPLEHREAVIRCRDWVGVITDGDLYFAHPDSDFSQGDVIRILPAGRLLVFDSMEVKIYDIPPFRTVLVPDQHHGPVPVSTPIYAVLLPGNRLVSAKVSSILVQPLGTYSLVACTNAGILAVTLSPTASHIRVLFTLPDEPAHAHDTQLTDVTVGWRRAYIQYYEDALAVSYDARQHIVRP
ncbi:hypothetical protein FIBSPDRAFT_854373, partial [Athelia psychrophila]